MTADKHHRQAKRLLEQISPYAGAVNIRQTKRGGKRIFVVDCEAGLYLNGKPDIFEGTEIEYRNRKTPKISD